MHTVAGKYIPMRRKLWFDLGLVHQGLALVSRCMCTKCLLVRLVLGDSLCLTMTRGVSLLSNAFPSHI